ncbi:NusG domain-containing protein [Cephalotus follicularis]|uniref:NusG domain-containing protein n=1 Tax=Cephalotus follicularis TaxID=3775 RepID=A0A1Q3BBU0_CEPFO|nr:NusG domain-containing protein [Cephalotus follicularis]
MKQQGPLLWSNPCYHLLLSPPSLLSLPLPISTPKRTPKPITATIDSSTIDTQQQQLTARERRQLRNERRESRAYNWREEVEERLIKKPKKKPVPKSAQLNLDSLALLGPQWWIVRVSRVGAQETAELIAQSLARNFPEIKFQVYAPAVQVKRKLKNGSYSVKPKTLFPGCVFLSCVLNKEVHDFIREVNGVAGFVGSKVGNNKRQINRPRPVSVDDMEAIFRQAKEEKEKNDRAFKEEEQAEGTFNFDKLNIDTYSEDDNVTVSVMESKPKKRSRKVSGPLSNDSSTKKDDTLLVSGSTVRVVSGTFAEFIGSLKKVNHKTGKATVGLTLFGKESLVDLDLSEIVAETK